MYKKIFINQCGYTNDMIKQVTFVSDSPVSFSVFNSTGEPVYTSIADKRFDNASSGEIIYVGDFSDVTESGRYYIKADSCGESECFTIDKAPYDSLFIKAFRFFYLQRCGDDLPNSLAGDFAHCACHNTPAFIYERGKGITDKTVDVTGGWHDAGDYGRYIVPGAMAVAQLLYVVKRNPSFVKLYDSQTPLRMPSFLDELKYELDFCMKLQKEDGTVYHKATCENFCGFIMPENEKERIVLSPPSVTATANLAAVCAMATEFYKDTDAAYADKLTTAARKAYESLSGFSLPGGFLNPAEITTGEYDDTEDLDELYWAAAEMYKAFGEAKYKADFERLAKKKIWQGYGWKDMGSYGNLAYLSSDNTDKELVENIKKAMISKADERLEVVNNDGYGTALKSTEYIWGCNMDAANNGLLLYDAYTLTGEKKYLDAAISQLHYLLGRNPMGLCYVTGCGTDAVKHPHHRPSIFLGKAMEGMLCGGPCSWFADETIKGLLPKDTAPAKCYVDMHGSYSTNEVTIYWNSALLMLLASVIA